MGKPGEPAVSGTGDRGWSGWVLPEADAVAVREVKARITLVVTCFAGSLAWILLPCPP
jgi:hypothetical protein